MTAKPIEANEREIVTFQGAGTGTYAIQHYLWSYAKLDGEGNPAGQPASLGTSATLYKALPPGDWRISFYVQDSRNVWSAADSFDITIHDVADLPDLAVVAAKTKMLDASGQMIWNPAVGERVFIETEIRNIGYADSPAGDDIVVTVFEDTAPVSMARYKASDFLVISSSRGQSIGAGAAAIVRIPWTVGINAIGNPINLYDGGYPDGPRVFSEAAHSGNQEGWHSAGIIGWCQHRDCGGLAVCEQSSFPRNRGCGEWFTNPANHRIRHAWCVQCGAFRADENWNGSRTRIACGDQHDELGFH